MFNDTSHYRTLDASLATAFTGAGAVTGMAFMQAGGAAAVPFHVWSPMFDPALGPAGGLAGATCGLLAYAVYWMGRRIAVRSARQPG